MAHPLGPTPDQTRNVDPVLTGIVNSRRHDDADFIGDRAFPPLHEEGRDSGQISRVLTGWVSAGNVEIQHAEAASGYTEIGFRPDFVTFACIEYGCQVGLGRRLQAASQVGRPLDEIAALVCADELAIQRELRLVTAFFGTGDWTNETTLGAAAQWDDGGGVPLANLWTAKRSIKLNSRANANAALFGYDSFRVAVQNGDITALVPSLQQQSQITMTTLAARLAEAFEFESLFVGRAVRNTADLSQTEVAAFVWTDNVLVYRFEAAGAINAGAAAQLSSTDGGGSAPTVTDRWHDPDTRQDKVRCRETRDELVVDPQKGYLIIDCAN